MHNGVTNMASSRGRDSVSNAILPTDWREEAIAMADDSNVIGAFTEEQAARLSGLKVGRLRYWDKKEFFSPTYRFPDRSRPFSRIYSFKDIVCLRTLAILVNDHKIRLQTLRETLERLLEMDQSRWADQTLYVLGRRVYFQRPSDQSYEDAGSGQLVLHHIPIRRVIGEVTEAVNKLKRRDPETIGRITKVRNVRGSEAIIEGTRIPVTTIKDFYDEGYTIPEILKEYPTLTERDVRAALRHLGVRAA